jgi:hypothetical protein
VRDSFCCDFTSNIGSKHALHRNPNALIHIRKWLVLPQLSATVFPANLRGYRFATSVDIVLKCCRFGLKVSVACEGGIGSTRRARTSHGTIHDSSMARISHLYTRDVFLGNL